MIYFQLLSAPLLEPSNFTRGFRQIRHKMDMGETPDSDLTDPSRYQMYLPILVQISIFVYVKLLSFYLSANRSIFAEGIFVARRTCGTKPWPHFTSATNANYLQ